MLKFVLALFVVKLVNINGQVCPNNCNGHGICDQSSRVCNCFTGFTGADCSLRTCPKGNAWADQATDIDQAHNLIECSNMGICDRTSGQCTCNIGYEGSACQRKTCPNSCNQAGRCLSMKQYAQTKDPGSGIVYKYDTIWDANKMYGCQCNEGYSGPDCTVRKCPTGDDPLTGNGPNTIANPVQVNEVQLITCKASGGYFTLTYKGQTTRNIPYNARADPEGISRTRTPGSIQSYLEELSTVGPYGIVLTMISLQACLDTSVGATWTIEFVQDFGDVPLLVPGVTSLVTRFTSPITVTEYQKGTKENAECSNRGVCDTTTGICTCSTNFDTSNGYNQPGPRGDCGYATTTIQYCPGIISCSNHGVGPCPGYPTYKCTCIDGWTGADCSLRTCPTGVSWFNYPSATNQAHLYQQVECSDMGTCDRTTGQCVCAVGFSGQSCELLNCPGVLSPCNSNGRCLDMATLASLSLNNGDLAGYTYGATPNNPYTWDAFMIQGCLCDSRYTGYDCSLFKCPLGDDPSTVNQADEQQVLSCTDADGEGNFILMFRTQSTPLISGNITTLELKDVLESLSSIGTVTVDVFDDTLPDQLCTPAGNQFVITFLTEHGDLPLITVTTSSVDSLTVTESVKGDKENSECSGRGICDPSTGLCNCFDGYGSSDGMGGKGTIGDCGFVHPVYVNIAN